MKERVVRGSKKKLSLHIDPIGGHTLSSYDFTVEYFTSPMQVVKLTKEELLKTDDSTYIIRVDTALVGTGILKCRVIAYIPDSDFIDGIREEIYDFETEYDIVERLR
jgi:hypothetical protein